MSGAEIAAIIIGATGLVGAVAALYTNVSKAQIEKIEKDTKKRREEQDLKFAEQENKNKEFEHRFDYMQEENQRLVKSLAAARLELDAVFISQNELRRMLGEREAELLTLKRDLATEKARSTELEKRLNVLTAERDGYLAQLQAASNKPGTGPLAKG